MAGSELELAVLCEILVFPNPSDGAVLSESSCTCGEAPAVHTSANTEISLVDDNLCSLRKITKRVVVKNDVIETGLLNLHLRSVLTDDEFSLEDRHVRVVCVVLAVRIVLIVTVVYFLEVCSVELLVSG